MTVTVGDRPRAYIHHGVIVTGWPAYFLGLPRVRRALEEELLELPVGLPATEIVDVLDACHIAGQAWISAAKRKSEAVSPEAVLPSNHGDELDTTEAAGMLGITPRRVRQLAESGALPARRAGSRWRFSLSEIEAKKGNHD